MFLRVGSRVVTVLAISTGCAQAPPPDQPRLELRVAPLALASVGVVCYDVAVTTPGDTVWSRGSPTLTALGHDQTIPPDGTLAASTPADATTVCSDQFGNGPGGGVTYIGTCDASLAADTVPGGTVQNRVTLWIDGIYDAGLSAELGDWQDPCPGGCSLHVDCNENEDSLAEFDLTVMRRARQGFFDVAVNFDDIFCSAKLDTCYDDDEPITLLHGADDERDWTAVFGLACTGGTDAVDTTLVYTEALVLCDELEPLELDLGGEGNTDVTVPGATLNYAVYRGVEELDCGDGPGSCKKHYWNFALSLDDLRALNTSCTLSLIATANEGDGSAEGLPGVAYPYVQVNAPLTIPNQSGGSMGVAGCQQNALDGDDSAVVTTYRGDLEGLEGAPATCYEFDGEVSGSPEECPTFRWVTHVCTWACKQDNGAGALVQKQCLCAVGPGAASGGGMIIPGSCNIANCANVLPVPPNWGSGRR